MYDLIGVGDVAFSNYIVNCDAVTDLIIDEFLTAIDNGYDPDEVKYDIFSKYNITTDDLAAMDRERILNTVINYMERYND